MAKEKEIKKTNKERQEGDSTKNFVQKPILGIEQNTTFEDKPSNFCTYALNAIIESDEGHLVLSKENANKKKFDFTSQEKPNEDFFVVGKVYGEDETVYYFLATEDGLHSEIGYVPKGGTYETIVYLPDFNFNIANQISGIYRLRLGCEKVIYWVEQNANNPIRYINFTKLHLFQDNSGNWVIEKFDFFYKYQRPVFEELSVIENGGLLSGSYNVSIQLLDANLNGTPWLFTTHPIPIYASKTSLPYSIVVGSSNRSSDPVGGKDTHAGKSIKVTVGNLDDNFTYYRLALIEATGFTGKVTAVRTTPPIPLSQTSYVFSGSTTELSDETTIANIKDKFIPFTAEILEQNENRLLAAKIKGKQYDFCSFQKYASKIATAYSVRYADAKDINNLGNMKNPDTYWLSMNYQGWEVYALGIVYVFPDFESPAYHIPGRPKNKYYDFNSKTVISLAVGTDNSLLDWNEGEVVPFSSWNDETNYTANKDVEKWECRETSGRSVGNTWGRMNYFENKDFEYPPKEDCNGDSYWGRDFAGNLLEGEKIRHHRFPSRGREPHVKSSTIANKISEFFKVVITLANPLVPLAADTYTLTITYEKLTIPLTYTEDFTEININNTTGQPVNVDYSDDGPSAFDNITYVLKDSLGVDVSAKVVFTPNIAVDSKIVTSTEICLLGIEITNIEYPHPDIIGHYIVVGKRDEFNRTVEDCGFGFNFRNFSTNKYSTFSYMRSLHTTSSRPYAKKGLTIFNPKFSFHKGLSKSDYIKRANIFNLKETLLTQEEYDASDTVFGNGFDTRLIARKILAEGMASSLTDAGVFPIEKQQEIAAFSYDDTFYLDDENFTPSQYRRFWNLSWSQRIMVATLIKNFSLANSSGLTHGLVHYLILGLARQVHVDLFNITYYRTHPNLKTIIPTDIHLVFGGDTFISHFQINNILFYGSRKSQWKLVATIIAAVIAIVLSPEIGGGLILVIEGLGVALGTTATTVMTAFVVAGAVAAITLSIIEYGRNAYDEESLGDHAWDDEIQASYDSLDNWYGVNDADQTFVQEGLFNCYVESEINVELRQPYTYITDTQNAGRLYNEVEDFLEYFRDRILVYDLEEETPSKRWAFRGVPYPEVYHYNDDFSRKNLETVYFPIPLSYDCCSECLEEFTNRIHYSEQSFQEELVDHYRVFLPNNYRDIEGEYGAITNLFIKQDKLFIHTTEAILHLPVNYQMQVTHELVTYLGTGEFFSIPPKKMAADENSILGSQHRWGTFNSVYGTIYVNELERKIYMFEGEFPKPISIQGIKDWSEEELVLHLNNQWITLFGEKYPLDDNPYNYKGIGFISVYDRKYNRFIITKKDYLILKSRVLTGNVVRDIYLTNWQRDLTPVIGDLVWADNSFYIVIDVEGEGDLIVTIAPTDFSNTIYFENKSWTLSYSKTVENWISWHSYTPDLYIASENSFYSILNRGYARLYQHNVKYDYCVFYDTFYPYIVEIVFNNPLINFTWENMQLHVKSRIYDSVTKQFKNDRYGFFDELIAYNDRQSTGLLNITVDNKDNANWMLLQIKETLGDIRASKEEDIWYINNLRDYVKDTTKTLFTKEWSALVSKYPIDKVVNSAAIDHAKNYQELEVFRSKYLAIRLISNTSLVNRHKQLLINYIVQFNNPSYR